MVKEWLCMLSATVVLGNQLFNYVSRPLETLFSNDKMAYNSSFVFFLLDVKGNTRTAMFFFVKCQSDLFTSISITKSR